MVPKHEADGPTRLAGESSIALERLSPAERRVFDLALDGLSTQAIADELVLSEATIRSHLTRIYAKLGVQGRIELLAKMASEGFIAVPDDPGVAAASPYGAVPWIATTFAIVGIVAGFVVPGSAIVFGPALTALGFALGRRLPAERRWARIPVLGAGAILCVEAVMLGLLFRPG
ncbi:MAG: helix-turn-helix transcriptional regulator [Chloroflexota bacterium]